MKDQESHLILFNFDYAGNCKEFYFFLRFMGDSGLFKCRVYDMDSQEFAMHCNNSRFINGF